MKRFIKIISVTAALAALFATSAFAAVSMEQAKKLPLRRQEPRAMLQCLRRNAITATVSAWCMNSSLFRAAINMRQRFVRPQANL